MAHANPSDQQLKELLINATTIAIVGASSNPDKASYNRDPRAAIPIPHSSTYPSQSTSSMCSAAPKTRRPSPTTRLRLERGRYGCRPASPVVAAARAQAGGLMVVMDACIGATHSLLRVAAKF